MVEELPVFVQPSFPYIRLAERLEAVYNARCKVATTEAETSYVTFRWSEVRLKRLKSKTVVLLFYSESRIMPIVSPPVRKVKIPKYCLHKATGQAYVHLAGADQYLGKHGTPESLRKYASLIAQHCAGAVLERGSPATVSTALTITELALAYVRHAQTYYVKNGKTGGEFTCIKSALRPLLELYGDLPAGDFGPIALKSVRQKMVDACWTRRYCNHSVGRIRRMYRWAIGNELIEPTVLLKLESLTPLLPGRTSARDNPARHAVPQESIDLVRGIVGQRNKDLIDLYILTGCRPGELLKLTGEMIDRTTHPGVWVATLKDHKTAHKGKQRVLVFGPKSQAILQRYLQADPTKRLFPIGRATFTRIIRFACLELGIPVFTCHWLRHTAACRVRADGGLDVAQVTLGHANASMTQLYAGLDLTKAVDFARDAG